MVYDLCNVKSLIIQLTSLGISNKDIHGSNSLFPNYQIINVHTHTHTHIHTCIINHDRVKQQNGKL